MRASITAALLLASATCFAADPIYKTPGGVALSGYDAVAYFSESKAVKGKAELELTWSGATWRFSSAANKEAFAKAPERYAPQFGGYCAWAVSKDYTYGADPEAWRIVEGKLYLNFSKDVQKKWEKDLPEVVEKANRSWPAVLDKPAK